VKKLRFRPKGVTTSHGDGVCFVVGVNDASVKLQVRPILLKKICFMIFFNNQPTTYGAICYR